LFLNEIKKQFITTYGLQIATAIQYAMNTEFSQLLAREMRRFSEMRSMDSISRVNEQIDEVRGIMVKSIENVAARGERLELLVTKTDNLRNNVSVSSSV
jgi:vesicle-associated membrane protein 7